MVSLLSSTKVKVVSLLSSTKVKVARRNTKVLIEVAIVSHLRIWNATKIRTSALLVGRKVTLSGLVLKRQPRKTIPKQSWFSQRTCMIKNNHAYVMHGERSLLQGLS